MSTLLWSAFLLFWIGVATAIWFTVDIRQAYARITGNSTILPSPLGDIEFKRGGAGVPVLVVHGSGGGYDQGELIARAILGEQFDWIAPSRFGYIGSTFREGATFDEQARAYAFLLDHLGLKRVAVLAMSHGGPSALLFAALYPERVSSLTLLSCGVASSSDADQAEANQKGDALTMIFKYEILYWLVRTFMRKWLMRLMGANGTVIASLTTEQRTLVNRVIDSMAPVAPRYAGVAFDNKATMPNERVAAIRAPTLIVHATDDALQLFHNAEFAAAHIPKARLVPFNRGGHLLLVVEQSAIQTEVRQSILAHAG
ncbi:MAG: alpha/beta hydrolase [Nitrospira sp.]|nr:alpha/beta hydrolase [Nitrospira sp.]MDH4369701.1 alpha/beta hydrolase [Nitrospira sp.]MDH5347485.1 alpha/beta hydrolase [Nitrospira sp.]MDH5497459.1 alpha/beta hydrolase [Nitrospira sp.]MDH5724657.1 alpha/beta hydrolase [Nitrospira sp.]